MGNNKIEIKRVGFVYLSLPKDLNLDKRRLKEEPFMARPKLGVGYLSAVLKKRNIDSKLYDQMLMNFGPEELIDFLIKDNIDLVGFYLISKTITNAAHFIKEIRAKTKLPVIAGGPGARHCEEIIKAGCDIVCLGEGEDAINEIVDYYQNKRKKDQIKGICYRDTKDEKIQFTAPRELIEDLDKIPFPLRTAATIRDYHDYLAYPYMKPSMSVLTSRGCSNNCAFCAVHWFDAKKYRNRSVENVIEEIKEGISLWNIKSIHFISDIFAVNFDWLSEFCQAINREKIKIVWGCYFHPLTFREKRAEAFLMMRKAGCRMISFGAQSADADILKKINRYPNEPEELRKAIYQAKKNGMTTAVTYIVGLPGETPQTIKKSLNFCREVRPHIVDFHPLEIIPYTALEKMREEGRFCDFDEDKLRSLSTECMLKYYLGFKVECELWKDILAKNPFWPFSFISKLAGAFCL